MDSAPFVEVEIDNISLFNMNFIILLRRAGEENVLPICIGAAEAHSIAAAYHKQEFPRPLTHDLMKNILGALDCELVKIYVTDLKDGTFYAKVFIRANGEEQEIDSRPSDAIALALRYAAPIFVHEEILRDNAVNFDQAREKSTDVKQTDPIDVLKSRLGAAVKEEKYERAAKLRDEIQRLEESN